MEAHIQDESLIKVVGTKDGRLTEEGVSLRENLSLRLSQLRDIQEFLMAMDEDVLVKIFLAMQTLAEHGTSLSGHVRERVLSLTVRQEFFRERHIENVLNIAFDPEKSVLFKSKLHGRYSSQSYLVI